MPAIAEAFAPAPGMVEICGNEIDDDGDGLIDCFDPDCDGEPGCNDFYFGAPTPDCRYVPPTAISFELELIFKTDETNFPIDQRCAAYVGDLDGDGIPEIVSKDPNPARLQIFSGATGASLQSIPIGTNHPFGQVALADVDRNGTGDIFLMENTVLARYEYGTNTAIWKTGNNIGASQNVLSPQIIDFDNDGVPEIYVGNRIFNSLDGTRLVVGTGNQGAYLGGNNSDSWPIAFDIFQSGDPKPGGGTFGSEADGAEFIAGNQVYTVDLGNGTADNGSMTLAATITGTNIGDGLTSIADIDGDGEMDIAVVDGGKIYCWNPRTQTQIGTTYDIPSTNAGGRLNIGDFDGDGQAELGTAGANRYVVLEYVPGAGNGTLAVKWEKTGLDDGSQRTGSTLFDFDGDGTKEVVYSEEGNLFILRGSDGFELARVPSEAGTRTEYPLVADVNGDGAAEIIVTAQNGNGPGFSGNGWVSVYRAKTAPWVSARPVWNQHGFNPTYINDNLTVPIFQQDPLHPSFNGVYNNFLVQSTLLTETSVPAFEATDASLRFDSVSNAGCPDFADVCFMVYNTGDAILPSITTVAFYDADPSASAANLITTAPLGADIVIDDSSLQCFSIPITGRTLPLDVWVMVNDTGFATADLPFDLVNDFPVTGTSECDFTNNLSQATIPICIELCENNKDDDGDGLIDEPNISSVQTAGCSNAGLPQLTTDIAGGVWSAISDIGTTVDQSGNVSLGQNFSLTPNIDTIVYAAEGCTDTVLVTVEDAADPMISCPGNANRNADASCSYSLEDFTGTVTVSDNCSAVGDIGISQNPTAGTSLTPGANTIILTATDEAGNTASCSFTLTVNDNIAPTITCPTAVTLPADALCEGDLADYTGDATTSDNCTIPGSITVTQSPVAGTVINGAGGNQIVVLTAEDEAGNTNQCSFSVTLSDTTSPSIACPATQDIQADSDCDGTIPDYCGQATISDNCAAPTQIAVTQVPVAGTVLTTPGFPATVTLTANDGNGNTQTCTFVVQLVDVIDPVIICPAPATRAVDASCTLSLPDFTSDASLSDNCSPVGNITVSQSPVAGGSYAGDGTTETIVLTASDESGNTATCNFVLTLADSTPPAVTCPAATDIFAQANCAVTVPDFTNATTSDNCSSSGQITVSQQPAPATVLTGTGTSRTVSLTAEDEAGNTATCSFLITVQDTTPPTLACPSNQLLSVDGACPVSLPDYTQNATADDNCSDGANITLSQSPSPGTSFSGDGTIVSVTITATDEEGNSVDCTFSVELDDATNPTITCPGDQVEIVDGSCDFIIPDYSAEADAVSACLPLSAITITQSPIGTTLNGHNTTQVITLTADNGTNTNSCTFTLTLKDQTKPALECPLTDEVTVDGDCEISLLDYTGSATTSDNCAATVNVSQDPAPGTIVSGAGTVQIVTILANDGNGNDSSCTFSVMLKDEMIPAVSCPTAQALSVDEDCEAVVPDLLSGVTTSDNCSETGDINIQQSPAAGTVLNGPAGTTTVTVTATDESGNANNCQVTITVSDDTDPMIVCPANQQLIADGACMATIPDYTNDAVASDNCTLSPSISISQNNGGGATLTGAGSAQTITLTADDGNGNTASCVFTVTLIDNEPPTVSCPPNQTQDLNASCQTTLDDYTGAATIADNCTASGSLVLSQTPTAGTALQGHNTVQPVTITVDDASGNMVSCSFTVTLIDTTKPVLTCPSPDPIPLDMNCDARLPDYRALTVVTDACAATPSINLDQSPPQNTIVSGDGTVTLITITATDENGNVETCSFSVTANDSLAPIIVCPDTQDIVLGANCDALIPDFTSTASYSDNCDAVNDVVISQSPIGTTITGEGTTVTITLTATDTNGNAADCEFTAITVDREPPSIQCPTVPILTYDANCQAIIPDYTGSAIVADNCAALPITVTQVPLPGTIVDNSLRQRTITLTADDEFGNTTDCDFIIELEDQEKPTITCPDPDTLLLDANCSGVIPDYAANATVADNCAPTTAISIDQNPIVGTVVTGDDVSITVTLTASDGNGNTESCTLTVSLQDSTPPALACPNPQILYTDDGCDATLLDYRDEAVATDNCTDSLSIVFTQTPTAGTLFQNDGTVVPVTIVADDQKGNTVSCSFDVTLADTTAPTITCPAPITEYADASCEVVVPDYTSQGVLDNACQNPTGITVTQSPLGTTITGHLTTETITLTATDAQGNADSCSFVLTVSDTISPTITCPADTIRYLDAACQSDVGDYTGVAAVLDNCESAGAITVTQQPLSTTIVSGDDEERIITLEASDNVGNTVVCQFKVTFQDTISPTIACPPDQDIFADSDCEAVIGDYRPLASVADNCEGSVQISVNQNPAIGTVAQGAGSVQVMVLVADDNNGNQSDCNFNVTVRDTTSPAILCPPAQTLPTDASCSLVIPDYTTAASIDDNCSDSINLTVSQLPIATTILTGLNVTQTITLTVTDESGNTQDCDFTLTLADTTKPTISCPSPAALATDGSCEVQLPDYTSSGTLGDNCSVGIGIVVSQSPVAGTILRGAFTQEPITLTATDEAGNSSSCSFTQSLIDTTSPGVICPANDTISIDGNCPIPLPDYQGNATITDNCSATFTTSQSPMPTTVFFGDGTVIPITIIVTDESGNIDSCAFTIELDDRTDPTIACPGNIVEYLDGTCNAAIGDYTSLAQVSSECNTGSSIAVNQVPASGTVLNGHNTMQTVTLTATDGSGNTTSCDFVVTVEDSVKPALVCPENDTVFTDANCENTFMDYRPQASVTDNCTAAPALSQSPAMGDTLSGASTVYPVTIIANDGNGNDTACAFMVMLLDTTSPGLTCPAAIVLDVDEDCEAKVPDVIQNVVATDDCSAENLITLSQSPAIDSVLNGPVLSVDILVTGVDESGNTSTCIVPLSIQDIVEPTILCPNIQTLYADGTCTDTLINFASLAMVDDNCTNIASIAISQMPPTSTPLSGEDATVTVTLTADDGNGNTADCDFTVQLVDTLSPTISCPSPDAIKLDGACSAVLPDFTSDATIDDNCSPILDLQVSQSPVPGLTYNGDNTTETITLTVTDNSGNAETCSFILSFQDSTSPGIICPANQTVSIDDACPVDLLDYTSQATVSDNCQQPASILVTQNPASGTSYMGDGTTVDVTLTADDLNGNTDSCVFQVLLEDNAKPSLTCPENIVQYASANCDTVLLDYTSLAVTDNDCQTAGSSVTVSQSPNAGFVITGHLSNQVVTLTASDQNGNDSTCTFSVSLIDTTNPTIICPSDTTDGLAGDCQGDLRDYTSLAVVDDNCQAPNLITVSQNPAPGLASFGHNTVLPVTLEASDLYGNSQTCTFEVTYKDTATPIIICPNDTIIPLNGACEATIGDFTTLAQKDDDCTAPGLIGLNQNPAAGFVLSSHLASQIVTIVADDGNGNTDSCMFEFSVVDTTKPSILCPGNQVRYADGDCENTVDDITGLIISTDNCSGSPTITQDISDTTILLGHNAVQQVILTADDGNGNQISCSVDVVLIDTTSPSITCPMDSTVFVDGNCEASVPDFTDLATTADNCTDSAAVSVTQSPAVGTTFSDDDRVETIILTADDGNGNFAQCTLNLMLQDTTSPEIGCPPNITLVVDGSCEVILDDYTNAATKDDNCTDPADILISQVPAAGLVMAGDSFVQTVTLTADDQNGNTQSCSFDITLDDQTVPSITCPSDTTANPDGACDFDLEDYTSRAIIDDNCATNGGVLSVSQSPVAGTTISGEGTVQAITLTVEDGNGNSFDCGFLLSLKDTTSPSITCPATQTIFLDANCQQRTPDFRELASIADNCADSVDMTVLQQPAPDSIFASVDTLPVTLTVQDGNGNELACSFLLQVQDTTVPGIQCPADTFIDGGSNCQFAVADYTTSGIVTDNCASGLTPVRVTQDVAQGTLLNDLGTTITVTLTATDVNGNSSSCMFDLTTRSQTPPPAVVPVCLGAAELAKDSAVAAFNLTDALDPTVPANTTRLDIDTDSLAGSGPYVVTFFASDTAAQNGVNTIPTSIESRDTIVYARIEDPSTGCYTVTPVTLKVLPLPTAPDVMLTVCANSINEQILEGTPQLLGTGTTASAHIWSLFDAGTTQANVNSFNPKDEIQTVVNLTQLKDGLLVLEYRFSEDYGNGLLVPSVPAYIRLKVNRTNCGGFPWNGDN